MNPTWTHLFSSCRVHSSGAPMSSQQARPVEFLLFTSENIKFSWSAWTSISRTWTSSAVWNFSTGKKKLFSRKHNPVSSLLTIIVCGEADNSAAQILKFLWYDGLIRGIGETWLEIQTGHSVWVWVLVAKVLLGDGVNFHESHISFDTECEPCLVVNVFGSSLQNNCLAVQVAKNNCWKFLQS